MDNEEETLNYSCGEKPIDFVEIDISNNPNYVFENDPLYNTVSYLMKMRTLFLSIHTGNVNIM